MKISKVNSKREVLIQQHTLLCSTPVIKNKVFEKTMVLITRHSMFGSTGIILNSPMDLSVQLTDTQVESGKIPLCFGGPHDDLLSFLVSIPSMPDGIRTSTYWSRNRSDLKILMNFISSDEVYLKAYKGCLSWMPGELEEEIKNGQWWATNEYHSDDLFDTEKDFWSKTARKISGHFAPLIDADIPVFYN